MSEETHPTVVMIKMAVQLQDAKDEIERLRAKIEGMREGLLADDQFIKLCFGEMTEQEMRTLRAGFTWVLNRTALGEEKR